jgi:hypothetical protein
VLNASPACMPACTLEVCAVASDPSVCGCCQILSLLEAVSHALLSDSLSNLLANEFAFVKQQQYHKCILALVEL